MLKIFERNYIDDDGIKCTWKYNLDINPNGPIEIENFYPDDYKSVAELIDEENKNLPLNKRKYIHPITGKIISYQRYNQLLKENKL